MIVTYDPIAQELVIDPDNGLPPMTIKTERLFIHIHSDGGHLGCAIEGDAIDIQYGAVGEIALAPALLKVKPDLWRLTFVPRTST